MHEVTGATGELVIRLIEAIEFADGGGEGGWYDRAAWAAAMLGGQVGTAMPDDGREPTPGTLGAIVPRVPRSDWFGRLEERFLGLIDSGMSERFLVEAVANSIGQLFTQLADVGLGDSRRAQTVEQLEDAADDPEAIARHRELMARYEPDAVTLSDQEVADRIRALASSSAMQPTSAEQAVDRWAAVEGWTAKRDELLGQSVLEDWEHRHLLRSFS